MNDTSTHISLLERMKSKPQVHYSLPQSVSENHQFPLVFPKRKFARWLANK